MGQTAFYPDLNRFCMEWATPIPGNTTVYGGPIRTGSEEFRKQFRVHQEAIFEHILLFDTINFSINGPNVIAPLIYRFMGARVLEELLDQDALTFVVWTPVPMMGHRNAKVKSTFVARIGDGHGSELDIEKIVDLGLQIQQVNMPDWYKASIRSKLIDKHKLLDEILPETSWKISEKALRNGTLEKFGLHQRDTIVDSSIEDGNVLLNATNSILAYRYILQNGMTSQNNKEIFDLFSMGVDGLDANKSPMEKYTIVSDYEKFPNLRTLYGEVDKPFELVSQFRKTHIARKFREWISTSQDANANIDMVREYVNACSKKKGMFESAPAKFLKLTGMIAIGHFVLPGAHLLGESVGAILSGVPAPAVDTILETTTEFGLGVIETFMIDNLKVGWTPRAYFDGLQRLQRRGKRPRRR